MKYGLLFFTTMLLSIGSVQAATVSLEEAVDEALLHAPALQSAQAARNSGHEDAAIGRAWLRPYLALNGSWNRVRQDNVYYTPPAGFPLANELNMVQSYYGIKAYQPLFDLGKWSLYKQGLASSAMGDISLKLTRRQTILTTAAAWLDVMRTTHRLRAAKASEQAMVKLAEQASAAFEVGLEPVNSSLAAISRRDLARAQRIRAALVLHQAQAVLLSLSGNSADVVVAIDRSIAPLLLDHASEQQWQQLADHEENVALAKQALALAAASKLKALGGAMPKLQLVAGWEKQRSSAGIFGTGSEVQSASIGVEVSMPLYAGGATWAQLRKSEQEKIRADMDLAEAQRGAHLGAQQAWLQWQATGFELTAIKAALTSARSEQQAAHAGFDAGLRTLTEVLDAEDRLANARATLVDSIASHALSVLQLYAAVGALDTDKVALVQQWLMPSR
ncbi:MAG: TolC family protein [Mariprofundus sp.]|nr:TolC family protein [Mariprofundus sp.]